jgi:threonine aldolase
MTMMTADDRALRASARNVLSHHRPVSPADALREMSASPYAQLPADYYGDGGAVGVLEERVAQLLGKPAGVFFMKGVIAQQCVLRVRAQEARELNVALHPLSHIVHDEARGLELLHGLRAIHIGHHAPFTPDDLARIAEPIACVVVELPLRRAGYLLPTWDELAAISDWCRQRSVPLHLDGARLWEAAAGYRRTPAEVAALADSVYVSFYKGMGALAGCVVTGEAAFLAKLKPWMTRHGASSFASFPYAVSALIGLDRYLPRMPAYVERAQGLARAVATVPGVLVHPSRPHVNAFQVLLPGDARTLEAAHRVFAKDTATWLFNTIVEAPISGYGVAEIVIGDCSDKYGDEDAVGWLRRFVDHCATRDVARGGGR